MAEILTPRCPLCGQPPLWVLGGGTQAFCGNDGCPVLTWDPTVSRAANLLTMKAARWKQTEGGGEPPAG